MIFSENFKAAVLNEKFKNFYAGKNFRKKISVFIKIKTHLQDGPIV
jgi:hypothetical protein